MFNIEESVHNTSQDMDYKKQSFFFFFSLLTLSCLWSKNFYLPIKKKKVFLQQSNKTRIFNFQVPFTLAVFFV